MMNTSGCTDICAMCNCCHSIWRNAELHSKMATDDVLRYFLWRDIQFQCSSSFRSWWPGQAAERDRWNDSSKPNATTNLCQGAKIRASSGHGRKEGWFLAWCQVDLTDGQNYYTEENKVIMVHQGEVTKLWCGIHNLRSGAAICTADLAEWCNGRW